MTDEKDKDFNQINETNKPHTKEEQDKGQIEYPERLSGGKDQKVEHYKDTPKP